MWTLNHNIYCQNSPEISHKRNACTVIELGNWQQMCYWKPDSKTGMMSSEWEGENAHVGKQGLSLSALSL